MLLLTFIVSGKCYFKVSSGTFPKLTYAEVSLSEDWPIYCGKCRTSKRFRHVYATVTTVAQVHVKNFVACMVAERADPARIASHGDADFETWLLGIKSRAGTTAVSEIQDLANMGDAVVMMMNCVGVVAESEKQTKPRVTKLESSVATIISVTTGWIKQVIDKNQEN